MRQRTRSGNLYERPITSERAHLLLHLYGERADPRPLLADGSVTLLAVAIAWYNGDVARAKAELYPTTDARPNREQQRASWREAQRRRTQRLRAQKAAA